MPTPTAGHKGRKSGSSGIPDLPRSNEEHIALLTEVGEIIRKTEEDSELLYRISCAVGRHFRAQRCLFNEIDLEHDVETVHRDYSDGVASVAGEHRISDYSSDTSREMAAGKTVVNHDAKVDPRTADRYEEVYAPIGERSYVAVPLMRGGRWVASLWISCDRPSEWSPTDVNLLEMIAERTWLAVERNRSESELRSKESELQTLADTTPIVLVRCGADLRYKFINQAGAALFNKTPEEMVGRSLREEMGDEAFARIASQIEKVLTGKTVEYDVEIPYPSGTHWMRVNYVPEYNDEGGVTGWIASIMDITEVRQANALVQRDLADMTVLRELGTISAVSSDRQTIWNAVVDAAIKLSGSDFGSMQIYHADRGALELLASRNVNERSAEHWRWVNPGDVTPCLRAVATHRRAIVHDVEADPLMAGTDTIDHMRLTGIRSMQSTPLVSRSGKIVGVISTHWRVPHTPSERDLGFLDLLARQAADVIEQKIDEDRLRESDERFRIAQRAGGVGIWDWNIAEGRTYWSETTWNFYGEAPGSVDPTDEFWTTHIHPEDRERVKKNLVESVSSRSKSYRDEFRILRRDGTILWIETSASITRDDDGRAIRIFGVNIDITERRLAEERLRASAQQLRLVTDAMPALISYVDKKERFVFANQTYHEWFGIAPEQVIGKSVRDVFGEDAYSAVHERIREVLAGKDVAFETDIRYRIGPMRYVHVSYTPDIDADGKVRGYFALTTDLTELKRSQELLRSTEQKVGLMMDTLRDYAIISLDAKGYIESWNVGARLIFGYEESEVVGRPGDVLFLPEDIAQGVPETEMRTARENGRAVDERWHIRKDGTRFFASGIMMPLYLGKRLTGYAKIASDLTEKQRQKEELQRAHGELELRVAERTRELAESNRALIDEAKARTEAEIQRVHLLHRVVNSQELERQRIARDIHDQLGQRLTGLRLKIESLKSLVAADPEVAERVERLQEISEGLDSEVSFLAWELRPTVLDDLGLIDALNTFVKEWSRHTDIAGDFQAIKVLKERFVTEVETHLYRITQEALNNINKHANAQNVTVVLEKRGRDLILIVEDDGNGFDITKLDRPRQSGRGLGLIGMQERATLIGGELDIESSENGTTIYVRVPVFES